MKCMKPVAIYWDRLKQKYSFRKPDEIDWDKCIVVSCGRCPACRKEWRTHLARRVMYELKNYNTLTETCFITLTADENHIDEVFPKHSLNHEYFKKFMKRLREYLIRKKIPHKPLKYLVCGEYGKHNTHRPHFHMILFGWSPTDLKEKSGRSKKGYKTFRSKIIEDNWRAGRVDIGIVTENTAPYMVKYIVKHSEDEKTEECIKFKKHNYVDINTGEIGYGFHLEKGRRPCFKNPTPLKNKKGEFILDDKGRYVCKIKKVRAPYIVYPKKILGIDYFLENFKQILNNGFIIDSKGHRHGIPKSFLKYCKNHEEDDVLFSCYTAYMDRLQLLFEEEKQYLISLGYVTFYDRLRYYREQGEIQRINYETFKNKNR